MLVEGRARIAVRYHSPRATRACQRRRDTRDRRGRRLSRGRARGPARSAELGRCSDFDLLSTDQTARIERDHGAVIARFGYR